MIIVTKSLRLVDFNSRNKPLTCHFENVSQLRGQGETRLVGDNKVFCPALCCPCVVINQTYSLLLKPPMTIFEKRKIRDSDALHLERFCCVMLDVVVNSSQ